MVRKEGEIFTTDEEVIKAVADSYNQLAIENAKALAESLKLADFDGIYLKNGLTITELSNGITDDWSTIRRHWNEAYDKEFGTKAKKNPEKYDNERNKAYNKIDSFSINTLGKLSGLENGSKEIVDYYVNNINQLSNEIVENYSELEYLFADDFTLGKKLNKNEEAVGKIKTYLDNVKKLQNFIKPLNLSGKENYIDIVFYGGFESVYKEISDMAYIYDKVRNYVTKKPYSLDKYKLYFENPQILGGWDKSKEDDYRCTMLFKDKKYYLAIAEKGNNRIWSKDDGDVSKGTYDKLNYKLLPGPNKMLPKVIFSNANKELFNVPDEINHIYKVKESFKKGEKFELEDCHKLIDYFKKCLNIYPSWKEFEFEFSDTSTYKDISGFYREIEEQNYKVRYDTISVEYVEKLVEEGRVYLFQIYNKDFSEYSKGTANLHTLFFKALFDDINLKNPVFKLSGGAELFMRPASIEAAITHPKNEPITNKNPNNEKKTAVFEYDLIKDKRYSENQYMLHLPIEINKAATSVTKFNVQVRELLKKCDNNYVIGIDRGERNLLYVCVINSLGEIVEQFSLNEIIDDTRGYIHKVDYHQLLSKKEDERKKSRQAWKNIENIKELKEGYIGQVVHKICQLIEKYDAIVAMEDLNSGFKRGRTKFEKQVYQKFEKALIDKLNYMVDKNKGIEDKGGIFKGYQLTNKFTSFNDMGTQNGFIFYIPAWLTSKIDPTTGFVDLLKPKYTSIESAIEWIQRFDSVKYDSKLNMFALSFDYSNFLRGETDYTRRWTIYTNGDRIRTFINPKKNNEPDNEIIVLTDYMKDILDRAEIVYEDGNNLIEQMSKIKEKDFWQAIIKCIGLILQMRNSISGRTDVDYLISPVMNASGEFYDSRQYENSKLSTLPQNADANGAYNIARKALWAIDVFKKTDDDKLANAKIAISNREWLEYAQSNCIKE